MLSQSWRSLIHVSPEVRFSQSDHSIHPLPVSYARPQRTPIMTFWQLLAPRIVPSRSLLFPNPCKDTQSLRVLPCPLDPPSVNGCAVLWRSSIRFALKYKPSIEKTYTSLYFQKNSIPRLLGRCCMGSLHYLSLSVSIRGLPSLLDLASASRSRNSMCPLTLRNSSAAHCSSARCISGSRRSGNAFFSLATGSAP